MTAVSIESRRPAASVVSGLRRCGGAILCCAVTAAAVFSGSRCVRGADEGGALPRHAAVLALKPAGYWPADEGRGQVVHDLSGHANHGTLYSVRWKDGLPVFRNDVYQWIQVPCLESYRGPNFSMGGWVYSALHRREEVGGEKEFLFGALIVGQPFKAAGGGTLKWLVWGKTLAPGGAMVRFGLPDERGLSPLEVVSGGEAYVPGALDAAAAGRTPEAHRASPGVLGGIEPGIGLESGKWQHIIYTFDESGEARLYIDGQLVHTADNVPYSPTDTPFVFGGGRWGTFNLGGTLSMAGSLQDMVLFDRTLSEQEVRKLAAVPRPPRAPGEIAPRDDDVQIDLPDGADPLIGIVKDPSVARYRRAKAALELARMGKEASAALPALAAELAAVDRENGAHLPRVEEFFRNALIRALLDIDPESENTDAVLAEALVKPYFAVLDHSRSYLKDILPLLRPGRGMEALRKLKEHFDGLPKLPKLIGWGSMQRAQQLDDIRALVPLRQEYFDRYTSKGIPFADAHYNAYNQIDTYEGSTFLTVVEGVAYPKVLELYEQHLSSHSDEVPDPEGDWFRVKIVRIGPDGRMEQRRLVGDWFIYDARDLKMHGWAVAVDRDGFIHLLGGQHNRPRQENFVPGSWEKLGIAQGEDQPQVMYWVSEAPGDITAFEFTGQKSNPRSIVGWMNYMNYARDPAGRLFVYGRGRTWSWALLRYDAEARRWIEISGSAANMLRRAEEENPEWVAALGHTVPYFGPGDGVVAAWQPGAYNFNRGWGGRALTFDRTGRMHVRMAILGVGTDGHMTDGPVYAYSDDQGRSFCAADGKPLTLPLTVNPIPGHNGSIARGPLKERYDLWASLVKELP